MPLLHPVSALGVIVLTSCVTSSVCVLVCVLPLSQPKGQTWGPSVWHVGQVEKYLGQGHRSKVKVIMSKNVLHVFGGVVCPDNKEE